MLPSFEHSVLAEVEIKTDWGSDQAPLDRARRFYTKLGYAERGRIPDFYAEGEAKVIFSRTLTGAA